MDGLLCGDVVRRLRLGYWVFDRDFVGTAKVIVIMTMKMVPWVVEPLPLFLMDDTGRPVI